uniref:glutathione peroxidase n=1 Tax=uncultured Dysgonomonas sp. TaxID=206096 RepID=UPI0026327E83|nr:glutathione peroxidase [uncultured Dysgonomonas sp.]
MPATIYDFIVQGNTGSDVDLSQYRGKVLLIVNTASKCGFTPQYKGLEYLYQKYKERGLVVLGFPCNQFANQEPANDDEIASFCELNFGVTFPLMKKVDVNGKAASPVYKFLKRKAGGFLFSGIKWNFTKFLVSRDGETVKRFSSVTKPEYLEKYILPLI